MASNILYLPFRRTHPTALSTAIKQYISTKYDQHPDMFTQDMDLIDKLRTEAVNVVEPHVSGIKKLSAYAAQLVWMQGKFPIDIGVDFSWFPALGYNTQNPVSQDNLRFELANIVFNLGSLYSQLAMAQNRSTSDGLKAACNYFCLAAGVMQYLRTNIIPELRSAPPEDMDAMTLESLEQLMLAQAQECFWQKAVKDGMKDNLISRLAAKVSDYYAQAGDFGIKSEAVSSEWIHHMTAKHHHFAAAAQYRAACDCLEKRKYGEEVARLRDSIACVNEALKEARYINKVVLGDLNGLKNRVQEDLKRAEKDNDMIYLNPVPPKSELKTIERANMAVAKVPKEIAEAITMLGDRGELGKALFAKLVPFAVHVAASIYVERRDRLVGNISEELDSLTMEMHSRVQSLGLPGSLQAVEKPLGLPSSLISHAEEIRQQDGLNRLYRSIDETKVIKNSDIATYEEGVQLLESEAAEDDRARMRYGTDRWHRQPSKEASPKVFAQITDIDGYLKSANNSDELVRTKLKEFDSVIRILSGSNQDIEDFVPSSRRANLTPKVEKETGNLRAVLSEINRIERCRSKSIERLREKAKADDINPSLLAEAARLEREFPLQKIEPVQFEDLFSKRLSLYEPDKAKINEERDEQSEILTRLEAANSAFLGARRGDASTRERELALQKLETGYYKYKEIVSNLEVGRKFYNDLAKIVARFRDEAKHFAYMRRMEAQQLESDISTGMASLSLSNNTSPATAQLQSLAQQKATQQPPYEHRAPAPQQPALTAPIPTRAPAGPPPAPSPGMWTPDMPIKFGGPSPTGPGVPPQQPGAPQSQPRHYETRGQARMSQGQWDPSQGLRFS